MSRCNNNQYRSIGSFGKSAGAAPTNNPLTYLVPGSTINSQFLHSTQGKIYGTHSNHGQEFMSQYCSVNWDGVCEYASENNSKSYPNTVQQCGGVSDVACFGLTSGEVLIGNTARKKYLIEMGGQCEQKFQPFDPTVADSPMIGTWQPAGNCFVGGMCVPVYAVNPNIIDKDPVMNKILMKPIIAFDVLENIYNTAVRKGKIDELKNTKLYKYFETNHFKNYIKLRKMKNKKAW
jgi:hypothetical protein